MYLKLLACEVLTREICHCIAGSPHTVDVGFTAKGFHEDCEKLRGLIQDTIERIDREAMPYDAILLGYGLCGNSTAGLLARSVPLVLPRAHDCCTLFLGSRQRFSKLFADNPSRPFSSAGYMERGEGYLHDGQTGRLLGLDRSYEQYVAEYGEENARYIMDSLRLSRDGHTDNHVIYIDVPETSRSEYADRCRRQAEEEGLEFMRVAGDIRLIRLLVNGPWDPEEFLVVAPGERVKAVYDWKEIVRSSR